MYQSKKARIINEKRSNKRKRKLRKENGNGLSNGAKTVKEKKFEMRNSIIGCWVNAIVLGKNGKKKVFYNQQIYRLITFLQIRVFWIMP